MPDIKLFCQISMLKLSTCWDFQIFTFSYKVLELSTYLDTATCEIYNEDKDEWTVVNRLKQARRSAVRKMFFSLIKMEGEKNFQWAGNDKHFVSAILRSPNSSEEIFYVIGGEISCNSCIWPGKSKKLLSTVEVSTSFTMFFYVFFYHFSDTQIWRWILVWRSKLPLRVLLWKCHCHRQYNLCLRWTKTWKAKNCELSRYSFSKIRRHQVEFLEANESTEDLSF